MKNGRIFTFYSYKGGTGRTMALVNIAVLLSSGARFKTLVVDWDLEAPGLDRYLKPYCLAFNEKDFKAYPGVIDYFINIQQKVIETHKNILTGRETHEILNSVSISDYIIDTDQENLHFMKAGSFDETFSKRINEFNWESLHTRAPEVYKKFSEKLALDYDFILIDSRTGLTDTSGICTMILPEKLVLVFTPNYQSLDGAADLARRAAKFRLSSNDYRPLKIYPLPSRIEIAEKELREQWRKGSAVKNIDGYQLVFENLFEEVYDLKDIDFNDYFDEVQIQHEPRFSYGEEIAVRVENQSDRLSMAESYNKFLNKLLSDDCIWGYKKFPVYHNLPKRIETIGREKELEKIMGGIKSRYPLITIKGPAGIGKTILALETGYRCLTKSTNDDSKAANFAYLIWISSKNKYDKRRNLNELLNKIASVMGFFGITQIPEENLSLKESSVADLLVTHKVLIIINNLELIENADFLRWIQNIPEPSKILITSRKKHDDIPSWNFELPGLNEKDALVLLENQIRNLKFDAEQEHYKDKLVNLVKSSEGNVNPKVMEFLVGIIKSDPILLDSVLEVIKTKEADEIFNYLHDETWKHLNENARCILKSIPLFVGNIYIKAVALRETSGLDPNIFEKEVKHLTNWNLIKYNEEDTYFAHPITREFGRSKLQEDKNFEERARERWSNYYFEFVKKTIVRVKANDPKDAYWNVLVSDRMLELDKEWTSVLEVLKWANEHNKDTILLKFTMLLVHYMDSRFYNLERLIFVKKAVEAAERTGFRYEEALLRIDALGWTYVEENQPKMAEFEIQKGLEIAEQIEDVSGSKKNDLKALANAWRARSAIESKKNERAIELINQAFRYEGSPWITFRVYMAAGDIELQQNNFGKALHYYETAKENLNFYHGEGHNYQIDPRIGIALLKEGKTDEAEKLFRKLLKLETIPIGQLYGEYGVALVKLIKGDVDGARRLLRTVKDELNRRTTSNLLQKLIENAEVDIIINLTKYQRINFLTN